jgi:biotin synthase
MTARLHHDWTVAEVRAIHDLPLFELVDRARQVHVALHPHHQIQLCSLLSVKTGGCAEDCGYCSQSSHHSSPVKPQAMLRTEAVVDAARRAKKLGATRFCMGAAWGQAKDGPAFERVLDMIRAVKQLGLETCVTLGILDRDQALRLKAAGLDTYNHNLDTSREFYPAVVSTRSFDERLATLRHVREAGIAVCCGGILGMGESIEDRCSLLVELSRLQPHPESVPVNGLVPIPGTPLGDHPPVQPLDFLRMIATARIVMPRAKVRLSAGRSQLSREAQLLCLYAGANSIFYGEELLTTPNSGPEFDRAMLEEAGLSALPPGV